MKKVIIMVCGLFLGNAVLAQQKSNLLTGADSTKPMYQVLAGCGQCLFSVKKPGCDLAIKYNDKVYLVSGTGINDHGDAHAADGFCEVAKPAKVQGNFVGDIFKARYFMLVKP